MHDPMSNEMETQGESTPFDGIISTVKSYIKNPELVTRETLTDLLSQLEEMKSIVDGEETVEEVPEMPEEPAGPSLSGMIGKKMRKEEDY